MIEMELFEGDDYRNNGLAEKTENDFEWSFTNESAERGREMSNEKRTIPITMLAKLKTNAEAIERRERKTEPIDHRKRSSSSSKLPKADDLFFRTKVTCCGLFFGTICSLLFITAGLVMFSKRLIVTGCVLVGVGVVLFLSSVALIILYQQIQHRKYKRQLELEKSKWIDTFLRKDLSEFPPDPVLRRGIVNLIYHGQNDCIECRKMREFEDSLNCYKDEEKRNGHDKMQVPISYNYEINNKENQYAANDQMNVLNHTRHSCNGNRNNNGDYYGEIETCALYHKDKFTRLSTISEYQPNSIPFSKSSIDFDNQNTKSRNRKDYFQKSNRFLQTSSEKSRSLTRNSGQRNRENFV